MEMQINLDNLTLGDLEDLETGSISALLQVFENTVVLEGVSDEELPTELRNLPWSAMKDIGAAIRDAVDAEANPEVAGKN